MRFIYLSLAGFTIWGFFGGGGWGGCVCVCVKFTLYITWNPIRKQPSDTANPVFLSMLFLKLKHTTYFDLQRSTIKIPPSK